MSFVFVGLGNPGEEYKTTRHNAGRIVLEFFRKAHAFSDWEQSAKYKSLESVGKVGKKSVTMILPETFMNKSGDAVKRVIGSKKQAESMVVVHDDLDIPIGTYKISWNKGSGGHRGVDSIIRTIKTETFLRIRVGISPTTPSGKIKKPKGEAAVEKIILGNFKPAEMIVLKKVSKRIVSALESFVVDGKERTMSVWNG